MAALKPPAAVSPPLTPPVLGARYISGCTSFRTFMAVPFASMFKPGATTPKPSIDCPTANGARFDVTTLGAQACGHGVTNVRVSNAMLGSWPTPNASTTLTIPLPETFHVQLPG